jgi:hypothetical protein
MAQTNAQPSQELPLDAALSSEELLSRKWFSTKFYPGNNVLLAQARDITELKEAENINDQLNGSLEQAMEVYWSDVNRDKRTKHP